MQTVRVETPGCPQVSCQLSNDRGSWRVASTPGEATVIVSNQPLKALCQAEGGAESSAGIPATLAPPGHTGTAVGLAAGTAAGLAVGGAALAFIPPLGVLFVLSSAVLGGGVGAVVDSSQTQLGYPPLISIPMTCGGASEPVVAASPGVPSFGVAFRGLSPDEAGAAGIGERGAVLVTRVADGGRAAEAGLRSGDIVLAIDGQDVRDAADLEQRVLASVPAGKLVLKVWREGQAVDLTLALPQAAP